jgi:hypothetical protein
MHSNGEVSFCKRRNNFIILDLSANYCQQTSRSPIIRIKIQKILLYVFKLALNPLKITNQPTSFAKPQRKIRRFGAC